MPNDLSVKAHLWGRNGTPIGEPIAALPAANRDLPFRVADFDTLCEALDYAARGETGLSFYGPGGEVARAMPYAELRERARALASRLRTVGVARGTTVAIVADVDPDFVCCFFACQYAGAIAVPLPMPTTLGGATGYPEQVRGILTASRARVALGPASLIDQLEAAADGTGVTAVLTADALMAAAPAKEPLAPLGPDEPSHLQYSSGSTRQPAGIMITQKALLANARSVARHGLRLRPGDRAASWLPFYHDMGLIGFLLIPVTSQVGVEYLRPDQFARRPLQWLKIISDTRATIAYSPGFGYELCVRRARISRDVTLDLSHWRVAGVGGEMIRPAELTQFGDTFAPHGFRPTAFLPSYGLAETTLAVSFTPIDTGVLVDEVDRAELTEHGRAIAPGVGGGFTLRAIQPKSPRQRTFAICGKPLPGYEVEIRDDAGARLGERHVGNVHVKGPSLMAGYLDASGHLALPVDPAGWLDTGDKGYMVDGQLVITGRQKDLIIVNGRNIWPQDLEWHVEQHIGGIKRNDVAAIAVDEPERVVVLVQCRQQDAEAHRNLVREIRAVLYRFAGVDCHPVLIKPRSLPITSSGKLSRTKAKEAYLNGDLERLVLEPETPVADVQAVGLGH